MTTAIRFDHVSKKFLLRRERARSFQELALNLLHGRGNGRKKEFWALQDVSFAVEKGEMVGLIGPNGAGKSTILKLISRIIEPTSGQIAVNGRVGALLELGAGFHPDLTGRENVFLNGSILGLSRRKIRRRFHKIVDFADIGSFIDAPVRLYSSGMYMRLGFSIAVHTDPDILLIDEVLAVGDHNFQNKCLDKIHELKKKGVTILLVSHQLDKIRSMCDRALWLEHGQIQVLGDAERVTQAYLDGIVQRANLSSVAAEGEIYRWGSHEVELERVELLNTEGQTHRVFTTGEPLTIRLHFHAHQRIEQPQFGLAIYHESGVQVNGPNNVFSGYEVESIEGRGFMDYHVPTLPLLPGRYLITAAIHDHKGLHAYDFRQHCAEFIIVSNKDNKERYGIVHIPASWHISSKHERAE